MRHALADLDRGEGDYGGYNPFENSKNHIARKSKIVFQLWYHALIFITLYPKKLRATGHFLIINRNLKVCLFIFNFPEKSSALYV